MKALSPCSMSLTDGGNSKQVKESGDESYDG